MSHGPGSSEDNAVEGKFSRIAVSGTIDSTHTRSITGAANHHATFSNSATNRRVTFSNCATDRRGSMPSRRSSQFFAALTFAAVLALAPHPAFAQHGGGGGGGHAGGGGFGGSHGGGGGHASGGGSGSRGGGASAPSWKLRRIVFRWCFKRRRNKFRRAFGPVLPLRRRQHVAGSSEHCNARRRPALHSFHHGRRSRGIQRARRKAARRAARHRQSSRRFHGVTRIVVHIGRN